MAQATQSKQAKKRVASQAEPREYTSDIEEFDESLSEGESVDESVAQPCLLPAAIQIPAGVAGRLKSPPSSRKKNSVRTNSAGIEIPLQKQLAEDIEASGGLERLKRDTYGLSKLCAGKEDSYGQPVSSLRDRIRDKVKNWKKLTPREYQEDVLDKLGVFSFDQLQQQIIVQEPTKNKKSSSKRNKKQVAKNKKTPQAPVVSSTQVDTPLKPATLFAETRTQQAAGEKSTPSSRAFGLSELSKAVENMSIAGDSSSVSSSSGLRMLTKDEIDDLHLPGTGHIGKK